MLVPMMHTRKQRHLSTSRAVERPKKGNIVFRYRLSFISSFSCTRVYKTVDIYIYIYMLYTCVRLC